jgi:hypothetical protein
MLSLEIFSPKDYHKSCNENEEDMETFHGCIGCSNLTLDSSCGSFQETIVNTIYKMTKQHDIPPSYIEHLHNLGILGQDQEISIKNLNHVIYEELMGERTDVYSYFYEEEDFEYNLQKLNSGDTKSFDDLLPYLTAYALNLSIVIIPMVKKIPILSIVPSSIPVIDHTLYLAYKKPGKYFPLLHDKNDNVETKEKCRCGVNDKVKKNRCNLPRCSCFNRKQNCSNLCQCKGCTNNKLQSSAFCPPRKRIRPTLNKLPTFKSFEYAQIVLDEFENVKVGLAQHFILESCIYIMMGEMYVKQTNCNDKLLAGLLMEKYNSFSQDMKANPTEDVGLIQSFEWLGKDAILKWVCGRRKKLELQKSLLHIT